MSREIKKITAQEIADSRGKPTLLVRVFTESAEGSFAVPSGSSTGSHEARPIETKNAIRKVEKEILPALLGVDVTEQEAIDGKMRELDGTPDKSRLGANSIIGVSIACARAASRATDKELPFYLRQLKNIRPSRPVPYLFMNLIEGGKHAHSQLPFQEYQIIPNTDDAEDALEAGRAVQNMLANILRDKLGELPPLGDEMGFAPQISSPRQPLELLKEALKNTQEQEIVRLGLDVAASSFYEEGNYTVEKKKLKPEELFSLYEGLMGEFSLLSIEDPFFEEDFVWFSRLQARYPELLVIGDDLTVTNRERLREAIKQKSAKAVIIKPNQVGTLTETLETMKLARDNDIECIVSHRSGETNDDFIADLAYAFGCYGLKAGAPQGEERMAKYNRLLQLDKLLTE